MENAYATYMPVRQTDANLIDRLSERAIEILK
jgi:hypothetical protein